jgi:hypothetical protein
MTRLHARASGPAALVIALLALLVAIGGTSVAAVGLAKNSVGTKQLQKDSVISKKVKDGSLTKADFAPNQLPAGPAGAAGTARGWAEVAPNGHVVRTGGQFPLTDATITRVSEGFYQIDAPGWGTPAQPQTFLATAAGSSPTFVRGSAAFVFNNISFKAAVTVRDAAGAAKDEEFVVLLP